MCCFLMKHTSGSLSFKILKGKWATAAAEAAAEAAAAALVSTSASTAAEMMVVRVRWDEGEWDRAAKAYPCFGTGSGRSVIAVTENVRGRPA